ncbi:hypothetical protein J3459_016368 [Metarhizium acridum]|nr:hypothetical protein J3459_016368 [Metarhizium acridum]
MELTDILWSFDDCIAIETFDEEKYTELQARNVAPEIYNILVRKNIELLSKISDSDSPLRIVPESPPTSPLYPMSPSSNTWQLNRKTNHEPLVLGSPSWPVRPHHTRKHGVLKLYHWPGIRSGQSEASIFQQWPFFGVVPESVKSRQSKAANSTD